MRTSSLIAVVAVLASVAVPTAWSAGGARNLAATPKVKAALRAAFIRTHSNLTARSIRGPLRGRTYYGSYQGREYAVAVFSIPRFGTQDQPEVFRRPSAGVWRDLGDRRRHLPADDPSPAPEGLELPAVEHDREQRPDGSVLRASPLMTDE